MRRVRNSVIAAAVMLLVAAGVWAAGGELPNDLVLPQAADSPGKVVFRHTTHVDTAAPDCTVCHPKPFRMLKKRGNQPAAAITHAAMEKGGECGTCHGKQAFAFDDCSLCHEMGDR